MKKKTGILSKIYIAILLIFLYSPIAVLIFYSFNNGKTTVWKGFTFKWYVQLFRDDNIMNALWNTVIIAVLASVFATILGTAAAIGISNFKGKKRMLIQNASNIYKCFLSFLLNFLKLKLHTLTQFKVKSTERLVKQNDFGIAHKRSCNCNTLLLTARKLCN